MDSHRGQKIFSFPRVVPCFPLLGLTPSGLPMGLSSTIIYTSELILCSTISVPSATRHNIHMYLHKTDNQQRVRQQTTDRRPTDDRQLANRFLGELFFTITNIFQNRRISGAVSETRRTSAERDYAPLHYTLHLSATRTCVCVYVIGHSPLGLFRTNVKKQ